MTSGLPSGSRHALAAGTLGSGWNFEASCGLRGRPEASFMSPVRGGEKSGRGRFAGEKQAAVHRSGQVRAESETSRPGVRVGSAREAVVAPGRRGKRADPAPDLGADERGKLVDRIVGECVAVHERTGERSAEKRLD